MSARIARSGRYDPVYGIERWFHAPETPARESRYPEFAGRLPSISRTPFAAPARNRCVSTIQESAPVEGPYGCEYGVSHDFYSTNS